MWLQFKDLHNLLLCKWTVPIQSILIKGQVEVCVHGKVEEVSLMQLHTDCQHHLYVDGADNQ